MAESGCDIADCREEKSQVSFFTEMRSLWNRDEVFSADSGKVYLDHNATTPVSPSYRDKIPQWLHSWGNASSIHWSGRNSKAILRSARQKVAELISAKSLEIVFTSGGSESNNLVLRGVFDHLYLSQKEEPSQRKRWITSRLEHPSVLETLKLLAGKSDIDLQFVKVDRHGVLDWQHYESLLNEDVALVSVMYANNETGTLLPIKKMATAAHTAGALFHTDAVQTLGKIPVDVKELGVDFATFSGHKFYALKGSGVLYCKSGASFVRQIDGGGQERHRRSGTENILAIHSLAQVAEWKSNIPEMAAEIKKERDQLQKNILAEIADVTVNGGVADRLPNTLNLTIEGVDGESLLMNLDLKGFAVSTGAACSAGSPEPSHALLAMGLSCDEAQSSLRISLGWGNQKEHLARFLNTLKSVVERLRRISKESMH